MARSSTSPTTKAPSKGFMHSSVHGVPTLAIVAGGGVLLYVLYKHFSSSSSSSSAPSSTSVPAYYPSGSSGSSGSGGGGYGYPGGSGRLRSHKAQGYKSTNCSCPEVPYGAKTVPGPPPCYCAQVVSSGTKTSSSSKTTTTTPKKSSYIAPTRSNTAVSTVTTQQAAQAQKSLQQAVRNISTSSPAVTTSSGQKTTTGALAYNNLVSKGYSQEAALQAAQQIAAANSGVPAGTPQLVAGTPVTSGSAQATNAYTPETTPTTTSQPAWKSYSNVPNPSTGLSPQQIAAQQAAQQYFLNGGTGIPPGFVT
jgi:hypothetical protein